LVLAIALGAGAIASAGLAIAREAKQPRSGGPVARASSTSPSRPSPNPEVERGRRLFLQGCSSCHGYDAEGVPGTAPSLLGAGEESADFYLRTGRMPLSDPEQEPVRTASPYTREQIDALVAYVGSLGGPPVPHPDPQAGDLANGRKLFTEDCAGCHQVVGQGGIVPGAVVPDLSKASPVDVAEAVQIGPYVMPVFEDLTAAEVDDIARYVEYSHHPEDRGGWGIGHIGPIPEGMVAWLLAGAALVLAIRLIGKREPG
jgi:ubiquinol-cytochrome c reductase cytochrome c subunit